MEQPTQIDQPELLVDRRQSPAKVPAVRSRKAPAQVAVPPIASQPTTPMDLLRIVTERGASVEEIGKFMDLMERQNAAQAKAEFVRAMAAFKRNPPDIYKDKEVAFTGTQYSHATLGNVCEQIIAALAAHGISHDWAMEQPPSGMIRVTCTLTHEMGHSKSTVMEAPADNSGKKNAIQSIASTVTYLERYTLLAACGVAVKDGSDDDGRGAGESSGTATTGGKDVQEPKRHPLSAKGFERALASVRAKEWTVEQIEASNALTVDQRTALVAAESGSDQ